jgi:hydrogenase maturation factor
MCLGAPGRILEIDGSTAVVDFWGVRRKVALDVVDEALRRFRTDRRLAGLRKELERER